MSDATTSQEHLQVQLVQAIERHAEIGEITALLDNGSVANDIAVMQAIETHADSRDATWRQALFAIPQIDEAWRLRQAADQAAYDLIESLEQDDLDGVNASLNEMAAAGDDANLDMGEGTLLSIAVRNRCDVRILKALIETGRADPFGFSMDAMEALKAMEDGPWRTDAMALFQSKLFQLNSMG